MPVMPFKVHSHGASDVGLVRTNNEDAWAAGPDGRIFIIADGLGGHQAGEVAAREAIEFFFSSFAELFPDKKQESLTDAEIEERLQACFERTNGHIFKLSTTHELLMGMGTTFCALTFHDGKAAISHVGDSRIYLLRDSALEQLTKDHCWTRGLAFVPQPEDRMAKGVLTRAIGTTPQVEATIRLLPVLANDLFLLCTDGLSDMVSHAEIESILNRPMTIGERVRMLVACAKHKGGGDNITVILIEVLNGTT
jgi:serine/threonine protein phosphatase PrpC